MAPNEMSPETGILLILHVVFPSVILLWNPWVSVDGMFPETLGWGKEFKSLAPGKHTVKCGVQIVGGLRMVSAPFEFSIVDQTVTRIRWRAPWALGFKGHWKNLGPVESS
jgi:hypothetical protein